jgi:hypothetical protein
MGLPPQGAKVNRDMEGRTGNNSSIGEVVDYDLPKTNYAREASPCFA